MALFHYFDTLTNTRGDSLVGYQVAVHAVGGGLQPIFADQSGTPIVTVSGLANLALTDSAGNYSYFVEEGTYDLEFRSPTGVSLKTILQVPMLGGPEGDPGIAAPLPETVDYTATAGQASFPATGELPFTFPIVDASLLTVFVNGLKIPATDYSLTGDHGPVVFDVGRDLGEEVYISAYPPGSGGGGRVPGIIRQIYARDPGDNTPLGTDEEELAYAFTKSLRVYCPAGGGTGPNGEYYTGTNTQNATGFETNVGNIVPGCELFGDGEGATVFLRRPGKTYEFYYNPIGVNRVELADSARGFYFHDFTIKRDPGPFDEQSHQIMWNGMTGVRIERVTGIGANGDFLHAGQGDVAGQVRFNADTYIDATAIGYVVPGKRGGNNRQGISILAMKGLRGILRVSNFTRPGGVATYDPNNIETGPPMVGAGDLEPNFGGDKLLMEDIDFTIICDNIGGAGCGILLPSPTGAPNPAQNIRIRVVATNTLRGRYSVYGDQNATVPYGLHLSGEDRDCQRPWEMICSKGVTVEGDSYNFQLPALTGYVGGLTVNDLTNNNNFHGAAVLGGGAQIIRGGDGHRHGGSVTGGDIGFDFQSTTPFTNATITTDMRGQSAYPFRVANNGEGEPAMDWATIDATGCNVHGQPGSFYAGDAFIPRDWAPNGGLVAAFPRTGSFPFNHQLRVKPYALGDATEIAAVQANTYPTTKPVWGVQRRMEPVPADLTSTYDTLAAMTTLGGGVKTKAGGKVYALARGYGFDPAVMTITSGASQRLELTAPDHATTGSYYWFKTDNTPNIDEIGKVGIFFGAGNALALWDNDPLNLNYANLGGAEYGRRFAVQIDVTGTTTAVVSWYRRNDADSAWVSTATLNLTISGGTLTLYRFVALESGEAGQIQKWGAP